jgi:hypothetical protein
MATMLVECTTAEHLSVMRFSVGLNAKDFHKEMFTVYVGKCLSWKAVQPWWQTFR